MFAHQIDIKYSGLHIGKLIPIVEFINDLNLDHIFALSSRIFIKRCIVGSSVLFSSVHKAILTFANLDSWISSSPQVHYLVEIPIGWILSLSILSLSLSQSLLFSLFSHLSLSFFLSFFAVSISLFHLRIPSHFFRVHLRFDCCNQKK